MAVTSIRKQRGVYQVAKYPEDGVAADEEEDGALDQLHPIHSADGCSRVDW